MNPTPDSHQLQSASSLGGLNAARTSLWKWAGRFIPKATVQSQKGQSLVELTLSIVFLLTLLSGLIDFGIAYIGYIPMRDAAEEGATYGALFDDVCNSNLSDRVHYASNTSPSIGINPANTQIVISRTGDGSPGNTVTVKVSYQYTLINPFFFSASIPLTTSVTQTILQDNTTCQ